MNRRRLFAALLGCLFGLAPSIGAQEAADLRTRYTDAVRADKPAAHWPLDKGAHTTRGAVGQAAVFEGRTAEAIRMPPADSPAIDADFSIEFWAKAARKQSAAWPALLEVGLSSEGGTLVFLNRRTGQLYLKRHGRSPATTTPPNADAWTHYVFTFTAHDGEWRWYANGELDSVGIDRRMAGTRTDGAGVVLGAENNHDGSAVVNSFNGAIDEVAVYPMALPVDRVAAHATSGPRRLAPARHPGGIAAGDVLHYVDAEMQAADFDRIAQIGSWVRIDANWRSMEPEDDRFRWAAFDRAVTQARQRDLKVLGLVLGVPAWANGGASMFTAPTAPEQFRAFCYALGMRYIPRGVTNWELGNEPNIRRFWQPRPDAKEYVTHYLLPGAAGLRAAADELNATVTILGGSMAPASGEGNIAPNAFLRGIYAHGGGPAMDSVAHHAYTYPRSPRSRDRWLMRTVELWAIMDGAGDREKRIWITEFGYATGTDRARGTVTEDVQALWADATVRTWSEFGDRAGPLFWYQHRDRGPDPTDREQNFGLWHHDGTPKPAAKVLADALE